MRCRLAFTPQSLLLFSPRSHWVIFLSSLFSFYIFHMGARMRIYTYACVRMAEQNRQGPYKCTCRAEQQVKLCVKAPAALGTHATDCGSSTWRAQLPLSLLSAACTAPQNTVHRHRLLGKQPPPAACHPTSTR